MKSLKVKWQRLIESGQTCPRCASTGDEVKKAVASLQNSLNPLGIEVNFIKKELSIDEFKEDPLKSNIIMINNQPLEYWLDAETGESECCDICGPNDCRTITVNGKTYEEIPSNLIIKGALVAASSLVADNKNKACCDGNNTNIDSCCC